MKRLFSFIRRRWLALVMVFVMLAALGIWQQSRSRSLKNIEIARVSRATLTEIISSSGKTKTEEQVNLHFQTAGRLAWVGVKEGDQVQGGQAIATLDTQALKKDLEKSLRAYSKERSDFEEDRQVVYKNRLVTDTIKRILEKNQWDLESAVLDVELDSIALQWATLVSPITGTVTRIDTPVAGVNVTVTDVFTISNISKLVFSANVDETDIGKIIIGMPVEVRLDAYPNQVFQGTVGKIAFSAETTSAGATVFPVEIAFTDPSSLRIGLNGDVTIRIDEATDALTIPLEAMREEGENKFVFIKDGVNFKKKPVKTGLQTQDAVEIVEGLSENVEVVTSGFGNLPKNVQ